MVVASWKRDNNNKVLNDARLHKSLSHCHIGNGSALRGGEGRGARRGGEGRGEQSKGYTCEVYNGWR